MGDQKPKGPPPASIPVTWKSGDTKIHSRAPVIQNVSPQEALVFGTAGAKTCGSCRFFQPRSKDERGVRGLIDAAIHEAKWKLGWIAPDPSQLGRCGMNEQTAVGPHSKSCDQYRENRGRLR